MKSNQVKIVKDPVIYLLAFINIGIHLIFINNLEYHRDELLYFSLGQHPAFGYATVPPLIGWVAWLMQNLFGFSLFAVRIFPAFLSGVMVFLVSAISKELGGARFSTIMASVGIIISVLGLRTFFLFQPVHLDLFFWTLSIFLVIKFRNTNSDDYLLLFGSVAGLALLNKYLIGLLFLMFLITIPFTSLKAIFNNRKFWIGIILGSIIFLPNLIWQITHGIPLINHLSELSRTQLNNVDRISFLKDQLIMPGAATILSVAGIIYLFISRKAVEFRFLGIVSLLVIITLMLLKGKSYYTIGIFPFLIAAGAVSAEKILNKPLAIKIFTGVLILLTIPMLPFGLPVFKEAGLIEYFKGVQESTGLTIGRTFEDGSIHSLPQDYADMLGWEEMTSLANKAYNMVPDKKACFIYCENYGQAGAITVIGKKYNLPEAISFHESFRYWIPVKFDPDPTSFIYINRIPGNDVKNLFRKITVVGTVSNPDAREYGTTVYLGQDPASSFNKFWSERLKRLNN